MSDFVQIKSQIVELVVPANSTQVNFTFNFQQFLGQKNIISLETFTINDMPVSPLGNILPTYAQLSNAFVTFYGQNPEDTSSNGIWLSEIPMVTLHRMINGTDPYVRDLYSQMPRVIVWEKSKITLATGNLGNEAQLSFVFQVGYSGNMGD